MTKARLLTVFFAVVSAISPAIAMDLGDEMPAADFIKLAEGKYDMVTVDGKPPHKEEDGSLPVGAIANEPDEYVFTFSYCPPGEKLCDPGYVFLPKAPADAVKFFRKTLTKSTLYTVVQQDGLDELIYELEIPNDAQEYILYRRHGYSYSGNPAFTLVYELTKKPVPAPMP